MAGFQAIRSPHAIEQKISIGLANPTILELALGEETVVLREFLDDTLGERRKITDRHKVFRDAASRSHS